MLSPPGPSVFYQYLSICLLIFLFYLSFLIFYTCPYFQLATTPCCTAWLSRGVASTLATPGSPGLTARAASTTTSACSAPRATTAATATSTASRGTTASATTSVMRTERRFVCLAIPASTALNVSLGLFWYQYNIHTLFIHVCIYLYTHICIDVYVYVCIYNIQYISCVINASLIFNISSFLSDCFQV